MIQVVRETLEYEIITQLLIILGIKGFNQGFMMGYIEGVMLRGQPDRQIFSITLNIIKLTNK